MFATFTWAEQPFATQLINKITPGLVQVAGSFAKKKKKYNLYQIFGKTYKLTEEEYKLYKLQRKAYEEKVTTINEELLNPAIINTISKDDLIQMYGRPTFKIETFDIPLIPYFTDNRFSEFVSIQLEKAKAKRNAQIRQDDEDLIALLSLGYII